MDDDSPLNVAVQRACLHLATQDDVNTADRRRCSLERYLSGKWEVAKAIQKNWRVAGGEFLVIPLALARTGSCDAAVSLIEQDRVPLTPVVLIGAIVRFAF